MVDVPWDLFEYQRLEICRDGDWMLMTCRENYDKSMRWNGVPYFQRNPDVCSCTMCLPSRNQTWLAGDSPKLTVVP